MTAAAARSLRPNLGARPPSSAFYGVVDAGEERDAGGERGAQVLRKYVEGLLRTADVLLAFDTVSRTLQALLVALDATMPVRTLVLVEADRDDAQRSRTRSAGSLDGEILERLEVHTRAAFAYFAHHAERLESRAIPGIEIAIPIADREGEVVAVLLAVSGVVVSESALGFLAAVGAQLGFALARHNEVKGEHRALARTAVDARGIAASDLEQANARYRLTREALLRASARIDSGPPPASLVTDGRKDRVLAMVAHDLRQPLNAILLAVTGLTGRRSPETERRVFGRIELDIIRRSVSRMARLAEDLLDVASIDARVLRLDCDAIRVHELIDETLALVGPLAVSQGIVLRHEVSEDVPSVWADSGRILQVLVNIIGNALKFTPRGGLVTVVSSVADERVAISVCDSGIGIRDADRASVFSPFWQVESSAPVGTGIGLTIANEIVVAHGGTIAISTTPGGGATFTFTLPIAP